MPRKAPFRNEYERLRPREQETISHHQPRSPGYDNRRYLESPMRPHGHHRMPQKPVLEKEVLESPQHNPVREKNP